MKKLRFLASAILACGLALGFTSCDKDDNPTEGVEVNGTASVAGENINFTNAYWYAWPPEGANWNSVEIEFVTFDYVGMRESGDFSKLPSTMSYMSISIFDVTELPEGTFEPTNYDVSMAIGVEMKPGETSYPKLYLEKVLDATDKTKNLVIEKHGNDVKINIESVELTDERNTYFCSFNWNGPIRKIEAPVAE